MPFSEFQFDTKHLLDKKALPMEIYEHMKDYKLSLFEWNLINIGTRTRFTAYCYELGSVFGLMFIVFAALWLLKFPVVLMEDLLKTAGLITMFLLNLI